MNFYLNSQFLLEFTISTYFHNFPVKFIHFNSHFTHTVILQEAQQTDVNDKLTDIFDEVNGAEGVSFGVKFFQLDHDQSADSITERKRPKILIESLDSKKKVCHSSL